MVPLDDWPDFSKRSDRDEWMEDPAVPDERVVETVDAVEYIGRMTGGWRASVAGLDELTEPGTRSLSILDVGTGNGAIARAFLDWGRRREIAVEVVGIDLLPAAIRRARERTGDLPGVEFSCTDLFELDSTGRFDLVHASLVLHHFPGPRAVRALGKMAQLSRNGVVVNDLHRHPVHWVCSKMLVPALTDNELAIHDGPVSVLRGFRRGELIEIAAHSGLTRSTVEWRFPFRWLLLGRH